MLKTPELWWVFPQSFHTVALNVSDTGIMVGVFWRAHHTVARSDIWTLFLDVFSRAHHTVVKSQTWNFITMEYWYESGKIIR